jgi:hypothetical protein
MAGNFAGGLGAPPGEASPPGAVPASIPQREALAHVAAEARSWIEAQEPADDGLEAYEADERPGRLPWVLLILVLLLAAWSALVVSGRLDPTRFGLPPYDPSRVQGWKGSVKSVYPGRPLLLITLPQPDFAAILPRIPAPPLGVEAAAVRRTLGADRRVWEVSATITNPTDEQLPVPPLELALLDAQGRAIERWTVRADARFLEAGATLTVETTAIDPPSRAQTVRVALKPSEAGRI